MIPSRSSKPCKVCGKRKPLKEFYRHVGMKDGHLHSCVKCVRERQLKHYQQKVKQ